LTPSEWNLFPPHHVTLDKAHGRVEERKIWASSELAGYIDFPHMAQVFRIERNITKLKNNISTTETAFGITSLAEDRASPEKILELNRGHWNIENRLHWVRDVTYDEDRSRIRKGNGPRVMASLRNCAISISRLLGFPYIPSSIRYFSLHLEDVLRVVGL
jgi:hypothetical protein